MRAAVILAGGAGTRLRPLSSDENPKQFLKLFDGRSLLQLTFARAMRLLPPESIYVSTNEQYADKCREHLPQMPPRERAHRARAPQHRARPSRSARSPSRPASARAPSPSSPPIISSATRRIRPRARPRVRIRGVARRAGHDRHRADGAEYRLRLSRDWRRLEDDVLRVRSFKEKPDLARAEEFLRAGNYAWNASMFVWRSDVFRRELCPARRTSRA